MKKRQLLERIEELEARVEALEGAKEQPKLPTQQVIPLPAEVDAQALWRKQSEDYAAENPWLYEDYSNRQYL